MKYLALALSFALVAGCETEDGHVRDDLAAEQVATSLDVSADLAAVSDSFKVTTDIAGLTEDLARDQAVGDVIATIEALVGVVECLDVDTDRSTYLELFFDHCGVGPFGVLQLDGSIRAELAFEFGPCGTPLCPVAALFELSTVRFELASGRHSLEIAGNWLIRAPLDDAEPMSSTGGIVLTDQDGRSLSMSSAASWSIGDDECVTFSAESQLTVNAMPENVEATEIGTIVASSSDVTRCNRECPSQGTVQLAYGAGEVLRWSYTGAGTAVVTGPGGRQFEVVLPCAR